MGCLGNSKTEDQRIDEKAQREANKKIEKQLQKERLAYKATHRLLLLGKAAGQGRAGQGRGEGGGGGGAESCPSSAQGRAGRAATRGCRRRWEMLRARSPARVSPRALSLFLQGPASRGKAPS